MCQLAESELRSHASHESVAVSVAVEEEQVGSVSGVVLHLDNTASGAAQRGKQSSR